MQLNDCPSENIPLGCGYCGGESLGILCTFVGSGSLPFAKRSNDTGQPSEQYPRLWLCRDLLGPGYMMVLHHLHIILRHYHRGKSYPTTSWMSAHQVL